MSIKKRPQVTHLTIKSLTFTTPWHVSRLNVSYILPDKQFRRCTAILQFITGQQSIAGGLPTKIQVGYIVDPTANYPTAGTCGLKFYLPTKHEMFNHFCGHG